jgi:hypothetical protein
MEIKEKEGENRSDRGSEERKSAVSMIKQGD